MRRNRIPPAAVPHRCQATERRALLERDGWTAVVERVGPAVVGQDGRPPGPRGVLFVRITAEPLIQLAIFADLFAIQLDAEAWTFGNFNCSTAIRHQTALDDVIGEVMIMRVRGEG